MSHYEELDPEDVFAAAEAERERQKEEELLQSLAAEQWAFDTGCKLSGELK